MEKKGKITTEEKKIKRQYRESQKAKSRKIDDRRNNKIM